MKKVYLITTPFILVILYIIHSTFNLNDLIVLLRTHKIVAPFIYLFIYILTLLVMAPIMPLTIIGIVIFGKSYGAVYNTIGCIFGLIITYYLVNLKSLAHFLERFNKTKLFKKIETGSKNNLLLILFVTRCIPIFAYGLQNYIYSIIRVPFFPYFILSSIMMFFMNLIYSYGAHLILENQDAEYILGFILFIYLGIKSIRYIIKKSN